MSSSNVRRLFQSFRISTETTVSNRLRRATVLFAMAVFAMAWLTTAMSSTASAQLAISVSIAPPALPIYTQPICPSPGYIWTPGYWSYTEDGGYFWVPGTWVEAPEVGLLWTPGYWGWNNGAYLWNGGYWGPQIGFYGGINYGYRYGGRRLIGRRWRGGHLFLHKAGDR